MSVTRKMHFMFQWKNTVHSCEFSIILAFFQYPSTLLTWSQWDVKPSFFQNFASWSSTMWYKLHGNHCNRLWIDSLFTCCCVGHAECSWKHFMLSLKTFNLQTQKLCQFATAIPTSLPKDASNSNQDVFLNGSPVESETGFLTINFLQNFHRNSPH